MQRRCLVQAGVLGAWLSGLPGAAWTAPQARKHALLVGVSALQHQPSQLWLQGPGPDVQTMHAALRAQGFAAAAMTVLADDGQGHVLPGAQLPTRAAIVQALHALGTRITAGDVVLLYWSGHGVRARGPAWLPAEADGASSFLLARDAARMPVGSAWPLQGAVADAELGAAIDQWLSQGAQVVVVMDVCHAAGTTRSASAQGLRWRGLRVADLDSLAPAATPSASQDAPPGPWPTQLPPPRPRVQGFVGCYACETQQRTPEWRWQGVHRGLFTHAVVQALSQVAPAGGSAPQASVVRYWDWVQRTLDVHTAQVGQGRMARSQWPRPVFAGQLAAPLWQASEAAAWQPLSLGAAQAAKPQPLPAGVQVQVHVQQPGQAPRALAVGAQGPRLEVGRLPVGTQLHVQVLNQGPQALYLRLLYADAHGQWHPLYPELAGDAPELPAARPGQPARWQRRFEVHQAEQRPERLRWALGVAQPQHWLADSAGHFPSAGLWEAELVWQAVP